ncbi:type I polyketide synthase [Sorangium atrum]|uniref:SDR family NAD(P)-dependent oxidoreductase n=1 Tax=Sorangium atrum TaxID=2995308 RepID=A0ABT5BPU6_9BACT|nr:type I polyketide synthase [Sorangium aterium]MDC0676172.1 SDR family NAD(P)-dependent oxidoreductase [Sorangium aterium]
MSADADRSPVLKRALLELRDLRARLAAAESARSEPIAIVGIGCRFPGGADTKEALWQLVRDGVDATREVPADRWDAAAFYDPDPDAPGKMYTSRGGFLDQVDGFDARFFGVSPREAQSLDPQHRLLLEVSWEALEDAAVAPDRLAHSRTGVFVGISSSDYAHVVGASATLSGLDAYFGPGTALNFAPGRLSYLLGLQGPSVAVDTACSSSLVAVHLACQSLRSRETDLALAAGVSLILTPAAHIVLCKTRVLSPEGRCKTFDASADGYARGEGCGVVVLRRLSDAIAAGDRILAVIRGSAVNQDGPSSGLTVPNGSAQQMLVREALANAGVEPHHVDYVEAHGTATPLGDPIEVRALAAALGAGREPERPILLGSVKTNIGHLEAGAGIAGLIKVALSLHHGEIPPHLHFKTPNPYIEWDRLPARVATTRIPWPSVDGRRIAGVSSFGASGTNAHVVLGGAPAPQAAAASAPERPAEILCVSARSEEALRVLADRYERHLGSHPEERLADVCFTARAGRAHFAHRLSVVASSREQLSARLGAFARGERAEQAEQGRVERKEAPQVAFLFTGQGSQYVGMGRELFATEPVFRRAIEECDALLRPHLERPLIEVLYPSEGQASPLDETEYTQPALFAVEYALSAQWKAWGIEPIAVLGHSVGEYVAACVAGVMGLEQGLELIATRGRLMQGLPKQGAMAALFADEATVAEAVRPYAAEVSVAAVNGPSETVVSGARGAVTAVVEALGARGVKGRWLNVSHAFHSPLMAPMVEAFERAASKVKMTAPQRKLIANVTGRAAREEVTQASYWSSHVRAPVRFMAGIRALQEAGAEAFVEVGPAPVLSAMGRRCVAEGSGVWLPSLRPKRSDCAQMLESLGALYVRGAKVDFAGLDRDRAGRKIVLPTYPFQRERHWVEAGPAQRRGEAAAVGPSPVGAPATLLGQRLVSPAIRDVIFESQLASETLSVLRDHRIYGRVVVSGVVHLSLVAAAAVAAFGPTVGIEYEDISFSQPLILPESGARTVQTILTPSEPGVASFQLVSLAPEASGADRWTLHTTGRVRVSGTAPPRPAARSIEALKARCSEEQDGADYYARLWRWDEHYVGASFQVIERIWRRDGEVVARLALPPEDVVRPHGVEVDRDAVMTMCMDEVYGQVLIAAVPGYEALLLESGQTFIGQRVDRCQDYASASHNAAYAHGVLRPSEGEDLCGDVYLLAEGGEVLARVEGMRLRRIGRTQLKQAIERSARRARRGAVSLDELRAQGPGEMPRRLDDYLRGQVADVLSVPVSAVSSLDSPRDLGLDSLMAVELRNGVQADLGVALPLADLSQGATLTQLTAWLVKELGAERPPSSVAPAPSAGPGGASSSPPVISAAAPPPAPAAVHRAPAPDRGDRWIRRFATGAAGKPRLRLFCFPHGGGSASAYSAWPRSLPPDIEVCAVQLPGRQERLAEPPITQIGPLVEAVAAAIEPYLDVPYALFGASKGALVAFELARELRRRGAPAPEHLLVAAYPAPHLPNPLRARADMVASLRAEDASAIDALRRFGLVPEALLDPDVLRIALQALRADAEVILGYEHREEPPLTVPVSVFGGSEDVDIPRDDLLGWARHTDGAFELLVLPGPHLFFQTGATRLLRAIARSLSGAPSAALRPSAPQAAAADEPIAIVGLSCRFPGGAGDPEAYWRLLRDGVDAIREVPEGRWGPWAFAGLRPGEPWEAAVRRGGFVDGIEQFDAQRFGISDAEAEQLDPLQRLVLDLCWEALAHAGQAPLESAGRAGGVFVGACGGEYAQLKAQHGAAIDAFRLTGESASLLAGRVSHVLGWRGPSLVVDTAFSSSLMAVHLASEGLRRRECDVALACGAHWILSPLGSVKLWKMGVLSPDARCRTFDVGANGFVRGEGGGALVLKRLSDAQRDGDRIWALIRGGASTHDGRTEGLLAPSPEAQEAMLRAAWARAGVTPEQIGYIEAHGTGTRAGDRAEARAIGRALGDGPGVRCAVGSVKTNLGHLEAAAGMAGLIKVVLSLAHEEIPPHLHLRQLNPSLSLEGGRIDVPTSRRPWPRGGQRRIAGVSAFGMSGTNVHVVVEEGPPPARAAISTAGAPLSAGPAERGPSQALARKRYPLIQRGAAGGALAERGPEPTGGATREPALRALLRGTAASERRRALLDEVAACVARLVPAPGALDPTRPLHDLGLDSLGAVELRGLLDERSGLTSSDTLLFSYPSIQALAGYLDTALQEDLDRRGDAEASSPAPLSQPTGAAAPLGHAEEPIAIVGLACRFPGGADDPGTFWELLLEGRDAVTEIPAGRWDVEAFYDPDPDVPGRMSTRCGAFLRDVDRFDAGFFGISPREAEEMDPQQRVLLELCWEALERAGQPPDRLQGRSVGVFAGVYRHDYGWVRQARLGTDGITTYSGTGDLLSVGPGRVAYALGLHGPSMVVDTACSSSLVAVHLACQSLRSEESEMALAAGVNLILSPEGHIELSQMRALSPDGRCKTFDARADGYGRGEGCGVLVLKRLADARRDGDEIWALILGSAVNQDGRSNGLTAPNGLAQQGMLRKALASAGIRAEQVDYIEAHGTGTPLGDPIEVEAIKEVFGAPRPDGSPCVLGSVKANIGHLESAAGVAGLIKVVLSMRHETVPGQAHFEQLSSRLSLDGTPLVIPRRPLPWRRGARRRVAGVSSFGISGTNAHVVLAEAQEAQPPPEAAASGPLVLPVSARSAGALAALARAYKDLLSSGDAPPMAAVCRTAGVRRSHEPHRLAAVFATREELVEQLDAFLTGRPGVASGVVEERPPRLVLVFPGQGSQWVGMGRALLQAEPAFSAAIEACEQAMRPHVDWSLTAQIGADGAASRLGEIDVVQPVLWAIEVALAALWRSWDVEPDAVLGHSMGEVAAAHVAGILSLEDAARIICRRSRLMRRVSGRGAMALVELTMAEAERALAGHEQRLSIAASNGPRSTVLSGDAQALDEVLARLEGRGVFCRRVKVDVASHSPEVEGLLDELVGELAGIRPQRARVPMLSTVTGRYVEGPELDARYWARNLREPVRFAAGVEALSAEGATAFLEASPHPVLLPSIEDGLSAWSRRGACLPSSRRDEDEQRVLRTSLAALYVLGSGVAWKQLYPGDQPPVALPSYPWQRERFWLDAPPGGPSRSRARGAALLGERRDLSADPAVHTWEVELSAAHVPYLADHRVDSAVVLPATAYAEMALAAARAVLGPGPHALEAMVLERVLALPDAGERLGQVVQTVLRVDHADRATFEIFSRSGAAAGADRRDAGSPWTRHARGAVRAAAGAGERPPIDRTAVEARCTRVLSREQHYAHMEAMSLRYGPRFQGVVEVRCGLGEGLARVRLPDRLATAGHVVHPALLDACFQAALSVATSGQGGSACMLPVGVERLRVGEQIETDLACHIVVRDRDAGAVADRAIADVRLIDAGGREVAEVLGLSFQRVELGQIEPASAWYYEVAWRLAHADAAERAPAERPSAVLVLADRGGVGEALLGRLTDAGAACVLVRRGPRYRRIAARELEVGLEDADGLATMLREAAAELGRPAPDAIVHLASLDAVPAEAATADALSAACALTCGSALGLAQAIAQAGYRDAPRLWLVTRGAQPVEGEGAACAVAQAPLWGFGRTLMHEHPELRCSLVDLDPLEEGGDLDALARELRADGADDQVAFRNGSRHVARLARADDRRAEAPPRARAGDRAFRLEADRQGVLDGLVLRARPRRAPSVDEVEIEVAAAGLNFRDVLLALGALPDPGTDASGPPLGRECAGRVVAVGAGVEDLRVGDEVIALASRCFGTHAVTPRRLVLPRPPSMSAEDAASIPLAFLTAFHALHHVARLRRGERVLIHAAAGGVGMAAVQIAARAGAEIFATAGSAEKRSALSAMGVQHVLSSRDLSFADEIEERTGGQGVDVVLNSLAGDFIPRSLDLLRDYGRFIELGMRDYEADRRIGLRPFLRKLTFALVDLRGMIVERPDHTRALFEEVMALFEAGELKPLPRRVLPIADASQAFALMARAEHIGKVIFSLDGAKDAPIAPARSEEQRIMGDATYLITGGLGGIGLRLAAWLVARGARHLVLLGRSSASERAEEAIAPLRAAGAEVRVARADVAVRAELDAVLDDIDRSMPRLRGVIHAAGLLDDGAIARLRYERAERVMAPKVLGAWNLHELTRTRPLDLFVLCSSATALLGSPGQASYTAANAFLDALAHHRRALGLPATAINWGTWREVGLAAAQENRGERLASRGLDGLAPDEGVETFARILSQGAAQRAAMRFHPRRWQEFHLAAARSPFLAELAGDPAGQADPRGAAGSIRSQIVSAPPGERRAALEAHLRDQIARVLRCEPSRVGAGTPLQQAGLDSLTAMELRNRLEASLGVSLTATLIWRHPTVADLSEYLASAMDIPLGAAAEPALPPVPEASPAAAALTDDGAQKIAKVLRALKKLSASRRGPSEEGGTDR